MVIEHRCHGTLECFTFGCVRDNECDDLSSDEGPDARRWEALIDVVDNDWEY